MAPSHDKSSQVPSLHISHVPERLASVPPQSRFSSPQTHFCIIENAGVTLFALFCLEESELCKITDLKKHQNHLHLTNNSYGHTPGNSAYACTCYGGRWVPSVRAQLVAGTAEVHVRTKTCSTSWCRGFAKHRPTWMTVSKDHLQAP